MAAIRKRMRKAGRLTRQMVSKAMIVSLEQSDRAKPSSEKVCTLGRSLLSSVFFLLLSSPLLPSQLTETPFARPHRCTPPRARVEQVSQSKGERAELRAKQGERNERIINDMQENWALGTGVKTADVVLEEAKQQIFSGMIADLTDEAEKTYPELAVGIE